MKRSKKYYELLGQLSEIKVIPESWEESCLFMETFFRIRRYAFKHHRLAEFDCNGEGWVRGRFYRCDDSTPGAFVSEDVTIFSAESDKIEAKIKSLCDKIGLRVEFQGDPRGATVQLYKDSTYIPL